ncbi:MAG: Wzz/FepE/Etk N-terminal domain-containing protein [Candidatus Omnitrophota bacterium]
MREKNQDKKDVDLVDVMDIIKRGKNIIAVSIILTLAATFFVTKVFIIPVYQASAKILVREEKLNPKDDFPAYDTGWQLANTQSEIIKSKNIIAKALEKTNFSNAAIRGIDTKSLKMSNLQKSIELELLEGTNVLELKFEHQDPVFAAKLVNAIAETYIEDRTNLKNKTVDQIIVALEKEIQAAKNDFINVENELNEIASQDNMIMLSGSDMVLDLQKYADLDMHLMSVNADIEMVEVKIGALNQSIKTHNPEDINLKFLANNDIINGLKSQIRLAGLKLEALMGQFNENHPDVVVGKAAIDMMKLDIAQETDKLIKAEVESLEIEKKSLIAKKEILLATHEKHTNRLNKVIKNQPKLARLNRDIEMKRAVYSDLMAKLQELRLLQQRTDMLPDAEIIESADIPEQPTKPNLLKNLLLGLIVGITIGFALAMMFSVAYSEEDKSEQIIDQDKERRLSPRTKTYNKVTCSVVGEKKEHICWSNDVSSSGMKIISNEKLKENNILKFEIHRDKMKPIVGNGMVVWTSPIAIKGNNNGYASGVKFYDVELDINNKKT